MYLIYFEYKTINLKFVPQKSSVTISMLYEPTAQVLLCELIASKGH